MPTNANDRTILFNRLLEGKLSSYEIDALIKWLGSDELDPQATALILAQLKQPVPGENISPALRAALEAKIPEILHNSNRPVERRVVIFKPWMRYAAAVLLLIGISVLFFLNKQSSRQGGMANRAPLINDVAPGKTGAILTLADNTTVVLDSMGNGVIATQNGSKISLNNGQLAYHPDGQASEVSYNTMTTPKGRQFQLLLSDGTKVWLNAASSLRYPTMFTGKERKVEITGEAYFEVAKNPQMPFKVKVNDQAEIEVLGTHFNVNAYQNETQINTTLLEGLVKISNGSQNAIIKPGQQAQVGNNEYQGRIAIVNDVNVEKVMAWKNGIFDFQDATLEEVMRQLERWYDIDVAYDKDVPKLEFIGKMGRDLPLSKVLRGLEISKVHFRLEGRKVVVLP